MNRFALLFAVLLFAACGGEDPGAGGPDCWTPPEGVEIVDADGVDICLPDPEEQVEFCFFGGVISGAGIASVPADPEDCEEGEAPALFLMAVLSHTGEPTYGYGMSCYEPTDDYPCDGKPVPIPEHQRW